MDIGTAKPTAAEMAGVPHHLIDIADPTDDYSLALYQRDAYQAIDDILRRGRIPILAGGTPLYVNAVLEGWRIPAVPPSPSFRAAMQRIAETEGAEALHRRLAAVDPVSAGRIPAGNVRRVVRALEIQHYTGTPMSELAGRVPPPYRTLIIGLTRPRDTVIARVDRRVDEMVAAGLVEEVRRLLANGVPPDAPAMSAIGYGEIVDYLNGRCTLSEAIERIKVHNHRYIRHQLTWLRRMRDVHWFNLEEPGWYEALRALVDAFLRQPPSDETTLGAGYVG